MKKYLFCLLALQLLACSTLFTSCEDLIRGEGPILTENRSTPAFASIRSNGSVRVYIRYADTFAVQIKAYSTLLPYFDTDVTGGVLRLGFRNNTRIKNDNTEVHITMPAVEGLAVNGDGSFHLSGPFPSQPFLDLEVNGSGTIAATIPHIDDLTVHITGSGTMNLEDSVAESAEISISGSGRIHVGVSTRLKARISGSGRIYYRGSPDISSEISGSGKLIKQ